MSSEAINLERPASLINFKNQPKLSEYEVDRTYNERRLALVPLIEDFIATEELFKDREVSVEFSHGGVSSVVTFIEMGEDKLVLKIPLDQGAEGEAQFLKAWEEVGVSVPHVFKEGQIGKHPYIIMSFIDAPILKDVISQGAARADVSIEMGKILAMMHTSEAKGYGRIIKGKPEYENFKDWISSSYIQDKIKATEQAGLLGDEHGPIADCVSILLAYCEKDPRSTYCHFDFGSANMLATEPLTVIDPAAILNHGIIDFGRSLQLASSGGSFEQVEQFKEGYLSINHSVDPSALQAAIVLSAYMKFPYWQKKEKTKQIKIVQEYLVQTRGNLL